MTPHAHEHVVAACVQRDFADDALAFLGHDDLCRYGTVVEEPFETGTPGLNLLSDEWGQFDVSTGNG